MRRDDFTRIMVEAGFVEVDPTPGMTWEFVHPRSGDRRYTMTVRDNYRDAIARWKAELAAHLEAS